MAKEQLYGLDSSDLSSTHWNLAKCFQRLSHHLEASVHRRRCWELEIVADGITSSGTLQTAYALAQDLQNSDTIPEALLVIQTTIDSLEVMEEKSEMQQEWYQKLKELQFELQGDE